MSDTGKFYCRHCDRAIEYDEQTHYWLDPEATGDDSMWAATCDQHDTFVAEHQPRPMCQTCGGDTGESGGPLCGPCDRVWLTLFSPKESLGTGV